MFFLWISNYTSVDPKYELKGFNEGFHYACLWWVLGPRKSDFSIFWPWFQKSTKWVPGTAILAFSGLGSRSRQNGSQEIRFQHFLALGPEVDKMGPRRFDFSIFNNCLSRWAGEDVEIEQFTAEWRHWHPLWPQKMHGCCGFGIAVVNF